MKAEKIKGSINELKAAVMSTAVAVSMMPATVMAGDWEKVTINDGSASAKDLMGSVIGILLTMTRYIGIGLIVFGVYEVVMSFMNDQPEKKVKGITIALAGVVCAALKSILVGMGIIGG